MEKNKPLKRILLVDDEETILNSIGIDLRHENYSVDLANNGDTALIFLAENRYDLVITDLAMPGVSGLNILQKVKEADATVLVIILTGYANLDSAIYALRLGADDYLQKPCDFYELLLRMQRCFEKQDLVQQLKNKNESLAESEDMKTLLLESTTEGIFGLDCKGRLIFINSSAIQMLGYQADELPTGNLHNIIHHTKNDGSPYPQAECRMALAMKESHPIQTDNEILWRKDGSSFPVAYKSAPIWKDSAVVGVVVIFSDISAKIEQEKEKHQLTTYLQQMEKHQSLNCMAGGIAHNFNNIFTAVLGNLELALNIMPANSPEIKFIKSSFTASQRAAKLSTKMLQFVGQCKAEKEELGLSEVVLELAQILTSQIKDTIKLTFSCDEELFFKGDHSLVDQVIINLITNGTEAIGDEVGEITLNTGKKYFSQKELRSPYVTEELPAGKYVYLEVTDTGKGMKEEILNRAFEPFFSEKFTGRGMGLATVLGIMRIHGGTIILSSIAGKGTTARVIFPAITPSPKAKKESSQTASNSHNKETILVADDSPEIVAISQEFLKILGYNTITASNGLKAIELFTANRKDIVMALLDVSMPYIDGIKVCHTIREKSDIPVIMVTGYPIGELASKFSNTKALGFLQKPFSGKDFEEKIKEMLAEARK